MAQTDKSSIHPCGLLKRTCRQNHRHYDPRAHAQVSLLSAVPQVVQRSYRPEPPPATSIALGRMRRVNSLCPHVARKTLFVESAVLNLCATRVLKDRKRATKRRNAECLGIEGLRKTTAQVGSRVCEMVSTSVAARCTFRNAGPSRSRQQIVRRAQRHWLPNSETKSHGMSPAATWRRLRDGCTDLRAGDEGARRLS
jgi:hypothetical protein